MTYLEPMQVDALLRPVNPNRVGKRDGMSHLEAYDVRRWLTTIFGFGRWSGDVIDSERLYEEPHTLGNGKPGFKVAYRVTYRLTVCAPDGTVLATYTEAAVGDGVMPEGKRADAHDFALKTAESQAMKRCAVNLGDGGGLSLYAKGSTDPVVRYVLGPDPARLNEDGTIARPKKDEKVDATDDHITEQLAPEDTPPVADAPPVVPSPPAQPEARNHATMTEPNAYGEDPQQDLWEGPLPQDVLRDRVLAIADGTGDWDGTTGQARKAGLTRVLMDANAAGLKTATVADTKGEALSLEALITREISNVKARASS